MDKIPNLSTLFKITHLEVTRGSHMTRRRQQPVVAVKLPIRAIAKAAEKSPR